MWDEMEDGLMNSIVTPAETFFFGLFVLGILTIAATTLIGTCGNIDDYEKEVSERSLEIAPGTMAVLRQSVTLEDTTIGQGTCVIVERAPEIVESIEKYQYSVDNGETWIDIPDSDAEVGRHIILNPDEDIESIRMRAVLSGDPPVEVREIDPDRVQALQIEGSNEIALSWSVDEEYKKEDDEEEEEEEEEAVYVHALAKHQHPQFTGHPADYRPLSPFESFFEAPVSTILFLHEGTVKGDVPLELLLPVETQTYTSWFRNFYLNGIYVVMAILGVLLAFLIYIGAKFEKKRRQWYKWHTLRATYISRLMKDKEKTRKLQENWERISAIAEENRSTEWEEALNLMQETLDSVLTLLHFEGENLTEKLQNMTEDDLWNIEKLWEANSTILRAKKQVEEEEEEGETPPVITGKVLEKITEIYMTSFIWLGLLPHHLALKDEE